MIQIKNRYTDAVIFEFDTDQMKICIEAAVKSGADLSRANLSRADLYGANLSRANLSRADLYGANLYGASYGEEIPLTKLPKQLLGMRYEILFLDEHIKIWLQTFFNG